MKLGPLDTYLVADPELAREVLFERTDVCPNRPDPRGEDAIAESGIGPIFAKGAKHKEFRALALAAFNDRDAQDKYVPIIAEETAELARQLATRGDVVHDIRLWSFRLVAEVTCRLVFSKRFGLVSGRTRDGPKDYAELASALEQACPVPARAHPRSFAPAPAPSPRAERGAARSSSRRSVGRSARAPCSSRSSRSSSSSPSAPSNARPRASPRSAALQIPPPPRPPRPPRPPLCERRGGRRGRGGERGRGAGEGGVGGDGPLRGRADRGAARGGRGEGRRPRQRPPREATRRAGTPRPPLARRILRLVSSKRLTRNCVRMKKVLSRAGAGRSGGARSPSRTRR